jgi:hypothetical protein
MGLQMPQKFPKLRGDLGGIRSNGRARLRRGFDRRQPMLQLVDLQMKATNIGYSVAKTLYDPVRHDPQRPRAGKRGSGRALVALFCPNFPRATTLCRMPPPIYGRP